MREKIKKRRIAFVGLERKSGGVQGQNSAQEQIDGSGENGREWFG